MKRSLRETESYGNKTAYFTLFLWTTHTWPKQKYAKTSNMQKELSHLRKFFGISYEITQSLMDSDLHLLAKLKELLCLGVYIHILSDIFKSHIIGGEPIAINWATQ